MAEKKHRTFHYTLPAEVDWVGRTHPCCDIAQGVGTQQRVGNKILPVYLTWTMEAQNIAQNEPHMLRMMIYRDTQQVGDNTPGVTEVLDNANLLTVSAPFSLLNTANAGRFRILYNRMFRLEDRDSGEATKHLKGTLKLRPNVVQYNGSTAGDIERNGLYILWITNANPDDNAVTINGSIRLWYTDV